MLDQYITLEEVIQTMNSGATFSIRYITHDASRKKGGKIKEFQEATATAKSGMARNIRIIQNGNETGMVVKVNIPLIISFNNKNLLI